MWRGVGFIRQVKLMVVRFVRLRGLPDEIAKGVALGIFIGMTPTFGFQMPIALFFAYLLRENRLAAILGAEFTWEAYSGLGWDILFPMWVCSILFGVVFGSLAYLVTLRLIPVVKVWRVPRWPRRHWHKKFKNRDMNRVKNDDENI